jgi:DNA-binding transcriptional LysR family regulator
MDRIDTWAAFVAVADTRSFVAAAGRLHRSPAAVTRAIGALEHRLGTRLFTRTTRAVALTDAGRRFLDPGQQLLRSFAALEAQVSDDAHQPRGPLRVTASVVFGRLHVLPIVAELLARHPAIDVHLILSDTVLSLVDQDIDVGVRIAPLGDSTLKAIRVGSVRRAIYASPTYLAAHGEPRTPDGLARHACIAFTGLTPIIDRWTVGRGRGKRVVRVAPRLVVNGAEAAIDAAVAGVGLTCVLSYMVDHLVGANLLRPVLQSFEPPPIPIHILYPGGRHLPHKTRLLLDAMVGALRAKFAQ